MDSINIKDKKITNLFGEALLDLEHYIPKTAIINSSNIVISPEFKFNIWNKEENIDLTDYPMHYEGIVKLCKLYGIKYSGHIPFKPLAEFIQFSLGIYDTLYVTYTESEILFISNKAPKFQNPLSLYSSAPANEADVAFVDSSIEMTSACILLSDVYCDRYRLSYAVYNSVLEYTNTKVVYGLYDIENRGFIAMPYLGMVKCKSSKDESLRIASLYNNLDTSFSEAIKEKFISCNLDYTFNAIELVSAVAKIKKVCSELSVLAIGKIDQDDYAMYLQNVKNYKYAVKATKLWGSAITIPEVMQTDIKVMDIIDALLLQTGFGIDRESTMYPVLLGYRRSLLAGELLTLCISHNKEE